jgi:selenide,water dikinase
VLKGLPIPKDPRVIVGLETSDDAGVYRLTDDIALVQTVDFFTPIVDDPFTFGQIAAANALSDVYAMGGVPLTAMNLAAFPTKTLPVSILREILLGGLSKLTEAGVALVGGHTVEDPEIKYGLSVTGTVHPDRILANAGARPGDRLVLTKPLGTGILSTALKAGMASEEAVKGMVAAMASLNRRAADRMARFDVHACTDITGFGLLGHSLEMASASGVGIVFRAGAVPLLPSALNYAGMGLVPAGAYANRDYFSCRVDMDPRVPPLLTDLLYDPQTSGGLLICLPSDRAEELAAALREDGVADSTVVGDVISSPAGRIQVY